MLFNVVLADKMMLMKPETVYAVFLFRPRNIHIVTSWWRWGYL